MLCLEEVRGKGCEEVSSLSLLFICQLATEDLFSHSGEKWENFELCCHPSFTYSTKVSTLEPACKVSVLSKER